MLAVLLHVSVVGALLYFQQADTAVIDIVRPPSVKALLVNENPQARNEQVQQRQAQQERDQRAERERQEQQRLEAAQAEQRREQAEREAEEQRVAERQQDQDQERRQAEQRQAEQQRVAEEQRQREAEERLRSDQARERYLERQYDRLFSLFLFFFLRATSPLSFNYNGSCLSFLVQRSPVLRVADFRGRTNRR